MLQQQQNHGCFNTVIKQRIVNLPGLHSILAKLRVPYSQGSIKKRVPSPLDCIAEAAAKNLDLITSLGTRYTHNNNSSEDRIVSAKITRNPSVGSESNYWSPRKQKLTVKSSETHPHQCLQCPQVFTRRDNLKQHVLSIHNGKRYHCELCQKSFTQSGSLNLHVKSAHGGMRVKCTLCDKTYARVHGLRQHYLQAHEGNETSSNE